MICASCNWNIASVVAIAEQITQNPGAFFVLGWTGRVSNGFNCTTSTLKSGCNLNSLLSLVRALLPAIFFGPGYLVSQIAANLQELSHYDLPSA
jgi:hypothetical protein